MSQTHQQLKRNDSVRFASLTVAALLGTVSACAQPPYIHDSAEFNRESGDFGKVRTERNDVTVCYWRNSTSAQEVASIANSACQEFGKVAVLESQDMGTCPMLTPIAANYACVAQADATTHLFGDDGFATKLIKTLRGY